MLRLSLVGFRQVGGGGIMRGRQQRALVTSAQKRALNEKQLAGEDATKVSTVVGSDVNTVVAESTNKLGAAGNISSVKIVGRETTLTPNGSMVVPVTALLAVATAGAYYMDWFPTFSNPSSAISIESSQKQKQQPRQQIIDPVAQPQVIEKTHVTEVKSIASNAPSIVDKEEKKKAKKSDAKSSRSKDDPSSAHHHRIVRIQSFPPSPEELERRKIEQERQRNKEILHDPDGHRVSVIQLHNNQETKVDTEKSAVVMSPKDQHLHSGSQSLATADYSNLYDTSTDETLKRAHVALRANLDNSFLIDLEKLTPAQLRIRVVQLVSEMGERTKWEAVRLKEFLAMKEREVADRYVEALQKQRIEFEELLVRRLREQESIISKAANEAIQAKEQAVESLVDAASNALKQEHDAEIQSVKDRLQREIAAKYEVDFGGKLAAEKEAFIKELAEKVKEIESLKKVLEKLQQNLNISRDFETSSQKAHRVSAAGLALMEKMETSDGASEEFAALKQAASENGVIGSALLQVPVSIKSGIPTLSHLQASFDKVHEAGRQAALVPIGRVGLGGQLAGMFFAKVTVPPSPDTIIPDTDDKGTLSDYILSRAHRFVQLGDLESAVDELDKLTGQTAFTVRDWKKAATDRIAVEKVLKVIKIECSLLNKSMAG